MSKCVRSQKREARRYKKELKMYLTVWEEEAANIKEFWRLCKRYPSIFNKYIAGYYTYQLPDPNYQLSQNPLWLGGIHEVALDVKKKTESGLEYWGVEKWISIDRALEIIKQGEHNGLSM